MVIAFITILTIRIRIMVGMREVGLTEYGVYCTFYYYYQEKYLFIDNSDIFDLQ